MLSWLNDTKRAELLLFYDFWKSLKPWQRKLYVGAVICLIPPAELVYLLPDKPNSNESRMVKSVEAERALAAIVMVWREKYAGFLNAALGDEEFVRKSVFVEYSFIALLRDLTHGGGGYWSLKVPGWKIGRLALNLPRLEQLVPMWLDEHKPNDPPTRKRHFFLVLGKRV